MNRTVTTLDMIRRVRGIIVARGHAPDQYATRFDVRLARLVVYLRGRYFRHNGTNSPV